METISLELDDGSERPFRHRGTRADSGVVQQIFVAEHYAIGRLRRAPELRAVYEALAGSAGRPLILDAGANIGASAVYFAYKFPKAHILALEPAPDNFALLQANTAGLDVDARCAAIGAVAGEMSLIDPGEGEWGYRTVDVPGGTRVPVLAATELIEEKRASGFRPFIAKIDIEGGEAELFSRDTGWVDAFPLLVIELHDWLLTGRASSANFLKCVAARNRDFVYSGESIFSIANDR